MGPVEALRRLHLLTVAVAAGAIVLVATAAVFGGPPLSPAAHADGAGPLGSVGEAQQIVDAVPAGGNPVTTFGVPLCVTDSNVAIVDSVGPWRTVGDVRVLGIRARTFMPSGQDSVVYATDGFPPSVADPLVDPVGLAVRTPCPPAPGRAYTELLVGMSAVAGGSGGGWQGLVVGYESSGQHLTLRITDDLIICGAVTAAWCSRGGAPPRPPN